MQSVAKLEMSALEVSTHEKQIHQVQRLEVACVELASLPSGRSVHQKRGNVFFRADVKLMISSQQSELKKAKTLLEKLERSQRS